MGGDPHLLFIKTCEFWYKQNPGIPVVGCCDARNCVLGDWDPMSSCLFMLRLLSLSPCKKEMGLGLSKKQGNGIAIPNTLIFLPVPLRILLFKKARKL